MAQENPSRLSELLELARAQAPVLRRRLEEWLVAVREEPALAWDTAAVRYSTYGLCAIVVVWVALSAARAMAPPPPANSRPQATTADFHVVCTSPRCGHHFIIHREFGFHKFPVECPACRGRTGVQGRRCFSTACQGRWVAPQERDGAFYCPLCRSQL